MNYPVFGECQCGKIKFSLKAAPKMVIACHCKECQKLSTSAFSITAIVQQDDIDIDIDIEGELHETSRIADSGNTNIGKFCSGCGNRIYQLNPAEPTVIKFKAISSLSDTKMVVPTTHVWTSEKQSWVTIPEGVQQFEKQR
ncbi:MULTISPECIES: GFA family protein [Vibrio]|uniref:GFA family protein n=1 Tax=Vibrio TaxID=662 RepID=UPI0018D5A52F|nr:MULTISPECIES: GFA family protein [Vibrio]